MVMVILPCWPGVSELTMLHDVICESWVMGLHDMRKPYTNNGSFKLRHGDPDTAVLNNERERTTELRGRGRLCLSFLLSWSRQLLRHTAVIGAI